MEIYTIGFTKKSAREFFEILRRERIGRLIDVRLNNRSQLAAFSKCGDLEYFLAELCGADYHHQPILSPTKEILDAIWQAFDFAHIERRGDLFDNHDFVSKSLVFRFVPI